MRTETLSFMIPISQSHSCDLDILISCKQTCGMFLCVLAPVAIHDVMKCVIKHSAYFFEQQLYTIFACTVVCSSVRNHELQQLIMRTHWTDDADKLHFIFD